MGSQGAELFYEVDRLRAELLNTVEVTTDCQRVEAAVSQ